jgi:hypothetical protein
MREEPRSQALVAGRHVALAELAGRQHGVVSIRQLCRRLGYSPSAVGRAVRDGRLHRLHRGVYAVGHLEISAEGRCLAGVLACGPGALLSHASAGWLWGLLRYRPEVIDVTAPVRRAPRPPLRLHSARGFTIGDRALVSGIPVTAVPRTLLDLAAILRRDRLERALTRTEERGLLDLGPLEDLFARTSGHPGHGKLRRALDIYRPPPFSRSELERQFLRLIEGRACHVPRQDGTSPATSSTSIGPRSVSPSNWTLTRPTVAQRHSRTIVSDRRI